MSSKPQQNSSGEAPRGNQAAARSLKFRRPVRKLFEPDAQPLDSALPPLSNIRPRKRPRLWLMAALLALAVGSLQPLASEGERPGQSVEGTNTPPVELVDHQEEPPLTNGIPPVEDGLVETNGFVETNEAVMPIPALPQEPTRTEGNEREVAPADSLLLPTQSPAPQQPAPSAPPGPARRSAPPATATPSAEKTSREPVPSAPAPRGNGLEFSAFKIITERNIFDPNRSPRRPQNSSRPKTVSVDAFSLVGIMSYDKGTFAFFDGTSPEFRKALKPDGSIAGFTVRAIKGNTVELASAGKQLELEVGMQVRREDQGQWRVAESAGGTASYSSSAASAGSAASASTSGSTGGSSSGGNADEVLKRLMERREQE